MKEFKCYDCDEKFKAETKEELLDHLYKHYLKEHRKVIAGANPTEKQAWMNRFEKDWAEASELG